MTITLTISERLASLSSDSAVVAGNTYPVAVDLGEEWTGSLYLRVRFGSQYYDIPFASTDSSVDVQMPVGYPEVGLGVYSEALEICSSEARLRLERSILEAGANVVAFDGELYDQWAGEVTELLVDDALDASSPRPVANSAVTPGILGALRKDVQTAQTVAGPVAFEKNIEAFAEIGFGTFSGNLLAGEALRIVSYERPVTASKLAFRISDSSSALAIDVDIFVGTGSNPSGQIRATSNRFWDGVISLTYNSGTNKIHVWMVPGTDMALSVSVSLAASDGEAPRPAESIAVADPAGERSLGSIQPSEGSSTMTLIGGNKSNADFPKWYCLASIQAATASNTGVGGVFMLASLLTGIAPVYGILYVSQRAGTSNGRAQWLCCSDATEQEDIAILMNGGNLEVWGKQRYRWHVWEVGLMAKWTSNSLSERQWTIYARQDGQAELPSGEGVSVAYPLMPRASSSALAGMMMASPRTVQTEGLFDPEEPEEKR